MDINKGITKFDDTLIFKKIRPSFYHFHFQMNTIWTNEPNFFRHYIHVMHKGWLSKYSPWELPSIPPMKSSRVELSLFFCFFSMTLLTKSVCMPLCFLWPFVHKHVRNAIHYSSQSGGKVVAQSLRNPHASTYHIDWKERLAHNNTLFGS
jgi:hypothetical protein